MRSQVITGMVAVAAALGAWAAVPAASAAPANVKSVPSVLAPSAAPATAGLPAGMQRVLGTKPITPAASAASSLAFGALWGVACKHPGDCLGIGEHETTTTGTATADLWAGTSWRATGLHLPGGGTGGDMVADNYAPNVLMAVGAYFRGSDSYPVDNIWTGTSWSMGPHQPAVPSGEKYGLLESVSCTSSTFCIASGSYNPASNLNKLIPLVELWNGSSWKLTPPPVPSSSAYADLDGVSCVPNSASPTKSSCVLSGYYSTSTGLQAWADSFDGEHWKNLNIPQPESSSSNIWLNEASDVSCSSPTSCALVGLALELNSAQTAVVSNSGFAETLANGTWTATTVRPSGKNSELIGVDCLSSTFCMASGGVGPYNTSEEGEGAVAVWNGSTWTPTLINPGANIGSELTGVDCTSTTYCVAVGTHGRYGSRSGTATSAFYNGTSWAQHAAP